MSTPESNAQAALNTVNADVAKVKAWYKAFPFYAGLILGVLGGLLAPVVLRHIL